MRSSDWSSDVCSSHLGTDLAAPAGAGAGGRSHAGSHHRRREPYHVIRRTRPALTLGASAPFLLRPAAQLRPSRACACYALAEKQVWWCRVGGGLAVSLHRITAFSPSRAARAGTLAARGRLRPLTAALRRHGVRESTRLNPTHKSACLMPS